MLSSPQTNSLSLNVSSKTANQSTVKQVRKFLRFYLGTGAHPTASMTGSDLALLEADIVTEVITISPQEILPVPQMPYCVLGTYSWRSEMLWIVDLENLLGYPPSLSAANPDNPLGINTLLVMVVQIQGESMGLVVPQIDNIIEEDLEHFKSSSSELFSEDVLPFLYGYFTDPNNNIIMLIDAEEIFHFFSINPNFASYK